jgi:hypothetical protein
VASGAAFLLAMPVSQYPNGLDRIFGSFLIILIIIALDCIRWVMWVFVVLPILFCGGCLMYIHFSINYIILIFDVNNI